jgi:transcriptional regulator with XRE-family HTH domain
MLRLEQERRRLGLTQSALGRQSGLAQPTVNEACTGKRRPGDVQLVKLAIGLRWTGDPAELLEEVPEDGS